MYLKRLEIQGFKSFANKTTLEFEKGITAVVGPNGSGKSNVADAIRWVLGEQSLKQLRGKKSEDVIFAGSEKKSKMSFATVTVTFDNSDKRIPLDYSEVSISRSIDRSGESDYFINGNKVRLLDVIDLVLKSNIGTSRHTVIGQGTIDQMVLAGPVEVKNLLDEASGVKTYYIRREKTMKRLEQTAQNSMRVQDLLKEIEPRLKSLRRQAKRMQERSEIETELKTFQKEFFSGKYWQVQEALEDYISKIAELEKQKKDLEAEISKHRLNLDKSEGDNKAEVLAYQQIQAEMKKLIDKKNKLMEDISMIRGKLSAEKSTGDSLDSKALGLEKHNLENQKNHLNADIERATSENKEISSHLEKQQQIFNEISKKLADIQHSMDNPENLNFHELSVDVEMLDRKFDEFYQNLERASDVSLIISFAQEFKGYLAKFKQKATHFAQNPFVNFEKQRKILSEILAQKDRISQELNNLELKRSKVSISLEYAETELSKVEQKLLHLNLELQKAGGSTDKYFEQLIAQEKTLNTELLNLGKEISLLEQKITSYHQKEQNKKSEILDEERALRSKQDLLSKLRDQLSSLQIEKAKLDTQKENITSEAKYALNPEGFAEIQKQKISTNTSGLEEKIHKLQNQLSMIGGIDELTLREYEETEQRYTFLSGQVQDLEKGIADLRSVIEELDEYIKKQFQESFNRINEKFESYFRILFNGGRAYLSVIRAKEEKANQEAEEQAVEENAETDNIVKLRPEEKLLAKYEKGSDDIVGIDIKATPPGKKLASISALSGGERSLTSIALLCALLSCFPSPFVMLDEVDAALDEANTIRFAQILGTLAHSTQFVTVTHNRETMKQGHTLYGVTMGDDSVSKVLSIKIEQATAFAK